MKSSYLVVGIVFVFLSPAVLLYGIVIEKGFNVIDPVTGAQEWVTGIGGIGYLLSLFCVISLWIVFPCIVYGFIGNSENSHKNFKSVLLSFEFFFLMYALLIIALYCLCFIFKLIPSNFPIIGSSTSLAFRIGVVLVILVLWVVAFLQLGLRRQSLSGQKSVVITILAFLSFGIMIYFHNLGGFFFFELVGSELVNSYRPAVGVFLMISGSLSLFTWIGFQIHEGKADSTFEALANQLAKVPFWTFDPADIEYVEVGLRERSGILGSRLTRLKVGFKVFMLLMVGVSFLWISTNTINLVNTTTWILENPSIDNFFKAISVFLSWSFFSIIPISMIIVFAEYLKTRFRPPKVPQYQPCNNLKLLEFVQKISQKIGIPTPILATIPYAPFPFVIQRSSEHILFFSTENIEKLQRKSPLSLKAAITHELIHIKNGDAKDLTTVQSMRVSLKISFDHLSRISMPFLIAFPISIVFLGFLPPWLTMVLFLFFFVFLSIDLIPHLFFPVAVSIIAGMIYYPIAVLLGKMVAMMDMKADLDTIDEIGEIKPIELMLYIFHESDRTNLDVVSDTMTQFRRMVEHMAIRDYFMKTPGIIIQALHDYFIVYYSNITSRLESIHQNKIARENWRTIIGKFVYFIKTSTVDIVKNTDCHAGLFVGCFLVTPLVFVVSIFAGRYNYILSILLSLVSLIISAKAFKYAKAIGDLVMRANKANAGKRV